MRDEVWNWRNKELYLILLLAYIQTLLQDFINILIDLILLCLLIYLENL